MFAEFSFVELQLGFELLEVLGETEQVFDVLEHDLADHCHHVSVFEDRYPAADHLVPPDLLELCDLGYAALCHQVHAGILDHLGDMPAHQFIRGGLQKTGISLVDLQNTAFGIGDEQPFVGMPKGFFQHDLGFFGRFRAVGKRTQQRVNPALFAYDHQLPRLLPDYVLGGMEYLVQPRPAECN